MSAKVKNKLLHIVQKLILLSFCKSQQQKRYMLGKFSMLGLRGNLGAKEKKKEITQRKAPLQQPLFLRTISGIENQRMKISSK